MINEQTQQLNKNRSRAKILTIIGLILILLLGAFLRFYQLGTSGYGNEYYAATVKSMLTSWHNFFFVSYEPGGSVSVDKPPLGFWFEALSALIFGVNGFALAFPNAVAGELSILLIFFMMKKHFGPAPALIAALALACVPITVATERNNTIDGMLVFTLLLATWAFWKSIETKKIGYLFLGVIFVGLGFNIKMLQAYMILPALYLLYFFGAKYKWGQRILHLGLATLLLLIVSFSWVLVVEATPAAQRPYVGSSTDNSELELIIGHNGLERLTNGMNAIGDLKLASNAAPGGPGGAGGPGSGNLPSNGQSQLDQTRPQGPGGGAFGNPPSGENQPKGATPPGSGSGEAGPNQAPENSTGKSPEFGSQPSGGGMQMPGGGQGGPGGQMDNGNAGILRLFQITLAAQASWLLPIALIEILLFILLRRKINAGKEQQLGLLFWAAWLLPIFAYFSFTQGLWHSYYLIMLGPALAALFGIAFWTIEQLRPNHAILSKALITLISGISVGVELYIVFSYPAYFKFFTFLLGGIWLISLSVYWLRPGKWSLILIFLTMLIAPLLWSGLSTINPNPDTNLPKAEPATIGFNSANPGEQNVSTSTKLPLLNFLLANTSQNSYLLATVDSHSASPYILATGRPVLALGGFGGSDDVIDVNAFAKLVSAGKLRYVLDSGNLQNKETIYTWVKENCQVVQNSTDGNNSTSSTNMGMGGPSQMQNGRLYDCKSDEQNKAD